MDITAKRGAKRSALLRETHQATMSSMNDLLGNMLNELKYIRVERDASLPFRSDVSRMFDDLVSTAVRSLTQINDKERPELEEYAPGRLRLNE